MPKIGSGAINAAGAAAGVAAAGLAAGLRNASMGAFGARPWHGSDAKRLGVRT